MDRQPRNIEQLVEAQIKRWMAQQAAQNASGHDPDAATATAPAITVSREFGSRGEQLARLVAERMGFGCWDKELLSEIARSAGVPRQLLEGLDEHRRTGVERFVER